MGKALEDMNIHEVRTKRDEVWAELEAVEARIRELEPPNRSSRSTDPVTAEPLTDAELAEPGPNAHPEGEDAI